MVLVGEESGLFAARQAIEMLAGGAEHGTVMGFLERDRKRARLEARSLDHHEEREERRPDTDGFEGLVPGLAEISNRRDRRMRAAQVDPDDDDAVAEMMELQEGSRVQRAVRVRCLAGAAMSYLVTIVPEDIGLQIEGKDLSQTPLLLLLEEAGIPVAAATQTISATLADAEVAHALLVPAGSPLIEVNRLVRDENDRPIEMIRVLYRPELYRFEVSMRRVTDDVGRTWESEAPDRIQSL